jgi:hypothetical protein
MAVAVELAFKTDLLRGQCDGSVICRTSNTANRIELARPILSELRAAKHLDEAIEITGAVVSLRQGLYWVAIVLGDKVELVLTVNHHKPPLENGELVGTRVRRLQVQKISRRP